MSIPSMSELWILNSMLLYIYASPRHAHERGQPAWHALFSSFPLMARSSPQVLRSHGGVVQTTAYYAYMDFETVFGFVLFLEKKGRLIKVHSSGGSSISWFLKRDEVKTRIFSAFGKTPLPAGGRGALGIAASRSSPRAHALAWCYVLSARLARTNILPPIYR